MSPNLQRTLAGPAGFSGVGVHTGKVTCVTLSPAPAGAGVAFFRTDAPDHDGRIPARGDLVTDTRLGTVIGNAAGVTVSTIEHLMAAFHGLGVDNALVTLDGPEVPILDGSCAGFVEAIEGVGLREQNTRRRYIEILEPIRVEDGARQAALLPADAFEMAFEIEFADPAVGRQMIDLAVDEASFRRDLAPCRTFGFRCEVEALHAAGLALGGSLENVVVVDEGKILNPEGLRRPDEFVRHKVLDALGDLYLLGAPLIGRFEGHLSGHRLNNALVRKVLNSPRAWRYAAAPQALARAV